MSFFDFGKPKKPVDPFAWAAKKVKQKVRKEARKQVKKATGTPGGGIFDWLFGRSPKK